MFANPACLSFLQNYSLTLDHRREITSGVLVEGATFPLSPGSANVFALGFGATHIGYLGSSKGFKFLQFSGSLGYSFKLMPTMSLGILVEYLQGKTDINQQSAGWISLGVFYQPFSGMSYGMSFRGLGRGLGYQYDGVASVVTREDRIERSLEIGGTFRYPTRIRRPFLNVNLSTERLFLEKSLVYKGAFEIYPVSFFGIRLGYVSAGDFVGGRYGASFGFDIFRLDYSIAPSRLGARFHQFSMSIRFSENKNWWQPRQ